MSAWITDREPTIQDTDKCGKLWVSYGTGSDMIHFTNYRVGLPWQPITYPEPYVKPKVWGWVRVRGCIEVYKNGKVLWSFGYEELNDAQAEAMTDALNRLEEGV